MSAENSGSNSWSPGLRRPPLPARHFRTPTLRTPGGSGVESTTEPMWQSSDRLTEVRHFRRLQAFLPHSEDAQWEPPTRQPLPLLNLTPPQERQVERLLALRRRTDADGTPSGVRLAPGEASEPFSEPNQWPITLYLPSLTQILWWLERYGTWCWLGVWLTGLIAGSLAAWLLWDPDFSKQVDLSPVQSYDAEAISSSSGQRDVVNSLDAQSTNHLDLSSLLERGDGDSPEWLFAGVALSCAAGAFVMSRWLDN